MWITTSHEVLKLKDLNQMRLIVRRIPMYNINGSEIGETEGVYYKKTGLKFEFSTRIETFLRSTNDEENEDYVNDEENVSDDSYESEEEDYDEDDGVESGYWET